MVQFSSDLLMVFLYFSFCAFLGWIAESLFRSIQENKLINAGFLYGPFVPIYGFGAVFIYFLSLALSFLPDWLEWIIYSTIPSILEYFSSLAMEKIFRLKLWDYSSERFNLFGRICLKFSLIWAGLTILALEVLQPFALRILTQISPYMLHFFAGQILMYFIIDTYLSSRLYFYFASALRRFERMVREKREQLQYLSVEAGKLPYELRRLLKPLHSFPNLVLEMQKNFQLFPDTVVSLLKKNIGEFYFPGKKK